MTQAVTSGRKTLYMFKEISMYKNMFIYLQTWHIYLVTFILLVLREQGWNSDYKRLKTPVNDEGNYPATPLPCLNTRLC